VPSRSLLLLASGPESMASLAGLSLAGTVVVLSACRSATGEDRGGEGVAGLLWGPVAAGASTVVASLWVVNQQTTADLMGHFHRYRAQGAGEAAALMAARAELAHLHPYYWAGFVAFGSRRGDVPVAPSSSKWLWWLAAVGVLGLVSSRAASRRRRRLSAAPH